MTQFTTVKHGHYLHTTEDKSLTLEIIRSKAVWHIYLNKAMEPESYKNYAVAEKEAIRMIAKHNSK